MVSVEVIKKLQLHIEKHCKPYKLTWLNQDNKVIIDKQCLILFFLDKRYFDSCDVVYMNMKSVEVVQT